LSVLALLIPISLVLGLVGLGAFLWSLRSDQYDDLSGSAERILLDDEDRPAPTPPERRSSGEHGERS
jgi:cbb3-type cytochrome oxidase maturation protein